MANTLQAIKRQIEILSLVEQSPEKYSVADLCIKYDVEVATINRDLRELRSRGFQIHSSKNKLTLHRPLESKEYNEILSLYLPLSQTAIGFPKNISLTTKKLKEKSLSMFVTLVNAIERRSEIEISYYKIYDDVTVTRLVQPYALFPTMRDWRLVAKSDGIFKQFFVDNISGIQVSEKRFQRDKDFDLNKLFLESFDTYKTDNPVTVKLLFTKKVAPIIRNRIWSETQKLETQRDGKVLLTMHVGDLDEIVGWVMAWGKSVQIVYPDELLQIVNKIAQELIIPD